MSRLVLALAPALLLACTHGGGSDGSAAEGPPPASAAAAPGAPNAPEEESKAEGVVIGAVVTNRAKVSILSRGKGDLRAVVRKNGVIVADGVTFEALQASDPLLHAVVTSAVAVSGGAEPGTYVDATLHRDTPSAHGGTLLGL